MGYYKNLEIAGQVEEPDRYPEPIPAARHVANQYHSSRFARVRYERTIRLAKRDELVLKIVRISGLVFLLVLIAGGVILW